MKVRRLSAAIYQYLDSDLRYWPKYLDRSLIIKN